MFLNLITSAQAYKAIIGKLSYAPHVCLIPRAALPANKPRPFLLFVKTLYYNYPITGPSISPRLEAKYKVEKKSTTQKIACLVNKMILSFNEQEALTYNVHFLNSFKCSMQI
uniref:Uncharacterized protein n=1 Tax=Glossina palpalis gambiensis TaxID=67801 RepID=A0A1B0BZ10_9MUSC